MTTIPMPITRERLELWFFREISCDQRMKLFELMGLPTTEIGRQEAVQKRAFRHIIREITR